MIIVHNSLGLPEKVLLIKIDTVWALIKILSMPDEECFPKRPSGAPLQTLSNFKMFSFGFVPPPLIGGSVLPY